MKKKDILSVLAVGILILGLGIGLILIRQSQEIREKAAPTSDLLVSLSPVSYSLTKDQKTTINIALTNRTDPAKDVSLYSGEVDLTFDSSSFSVSGLTCNSGFLSSTAVSSVSGNTISIACFAPGGSGPRIIAGGAQSNLASFDITGLNKTGTSQMTVARANVPDATTFSDLSGGTGLGGSYTISGVGGGSTPTPAPAATSNSNNNNSNNNSISNQTTSPTKTPTPKPTAKATAKPKGTTTPSPTATPEVILLATPTPTEIALPTATPQTLLGQLTSSNILLLGGIGAIILSFLIALILTFRKKSDNPPTQGGTTTTPPIGSISQPEQGMNQQTMPYPYNQPVNPPVAEPPTPSYTPPAPPVQSVPPQPPNLMP